jgi:hypothetical protein
VILACRDDAKGRAAAAEILLQDFCARVICLPLDLSR